MKKIIFSLIALTIIFSGSTAFAYEPVNNSCDLDDHAVYGSLSSRSTVTSCITDEAWDLEALLSQGAKTFIPKGVSIMTTFGFVDTCPAWYFHGCEIRTNLFSHFIK